MKIGIVSQPLDSIEPSLDPRSSIAILSCNFGRLLAARGHDVTIYTHSTRKIAAVAGLPGEPRLVEIRSPRRAHKILLGLARRAGPFLQPGVPFIGSFLYDPAYAIRVALNARRRGIEIIHVHNFAQYGPIMRTLCPGAKVVLHMHCLWLNYFDRAITWRRLRSFDRVIGCSDFIRDAARAAFPDAARKVETLYNGVDTERFDGRHSDVICPHVYFIGRVSPEKGVHILIEAFKRVAQEIPAAQLFVVGATAPLPRSLFATLGADPVLERHVGPIYADDEHPPYLQSLQRAAGETLYGRLHFTGPLSHEQLIERLRSATMVVQPSLCQEAFGMPVAEAMAMGLPVIVTRAGGLAEIVQNGRTGLIVERGDAVGLAAAIVDLLRAPDLCRAMGIAGRQRVVERFAFIHLARQLEHHYRTLLQPPPLDSMFAP